MTDKTTAARHVARYADGPHGRIAFLHHQGVAGPGLVWLGGYGSDMRGTKSEVAHAHAQERGLSFLRFDYSGHGESDGDFEDGTISQWKQDAAWALETLTEGPQILIGSSMGGWIAGLLAREVPQKVAGLILIAPAPDFATELTPKQWPTEQWTTLQRDGVVRIPSPYDDSVMVYTRAMFEDGATQQVLNRPLPFAGPVRILSGMKDDVVPWQHAMRYAEHIGSDDIVSTLVKDGDHRLSSPADLTRLCQTIDELTGGLGE